MQQRYLDKIHDAIGKDIIDANYFAILGDLCEFSIKSLTALGSEMFRLTSKTRGGLFLMLVFFYFSYLFGAMYYVETVGNDWNQVCSSVGQCMYVMMRLAFFDGTGSNTPLILLHSQCFYIRKHFTFRIGLCE